MKDIPTFDEYSLYLNYREAETPEIINSFGMETTDNEFALIPIKVSENHLALIPGPEFSSILYRGQNAFHSVCKPTIHRPMRKSAKLIALLKKTEFIETIQSNPFVHLLQDISITPFPNKQYGIKIDFEALAQHYEFKTNHLDLTRSKEVAMFFASTLYDSKTRSFSPFTEDREVVLYKYNIQLALILNEGTLNPIGFQPLPRPNLQKAFSIAFDKNINFNDSKIVNYDRIIVSKEESKRLYEMFEGGMKLFPQDMFDEFAYEILDSDSIPIDVIEMYSSRFRINKKIILNCLKEESYSVRQNMTTFRGIDNELLSQIHEKTILELNDRIKIRGVVRPD